jgi:hypothetical protein
MDNWFQRLPWPTILTFFGGLVALVGAMWSAIKQESETAAHVKEEKRLLTELNSKNEELALRNREMFEYVTGGDSFCFLRLKELSDGSYQMRIVHEGKYPVHNLTLEIVDAAAFVKLQKVTNDLERMILENRAIRKVQLPVMTSEMSQQVRNFPFPKDNDYIEFGIDINSVNKSLFQTLQLSRVKGKWKSASRILDRRTKSFFREFVDEGYPTGADGQIGWLPVEY